jgi:hypothetical protein
MNPGPALKPDGVFRRVWRALLDLTEAFDETETDRLRDRVIRLEEKIATLGGGVTIPEPGSKSSLHEVVP